MRNKLSSDNKGGSPLVIILIVVVLAAVAGVGYYVFKKQKDSKSSTTQQAAQKAAEAACDSEDKNICKFYAGWKDTKYYTVTSTSTNNGETTTTKYVYVMPDKFHLNTSGDPAYEIIGIGNATYTKDTATGMWYKQTTKTEEDKKLTEENTVSFDEPTKEETAKEKTTYKFIANEACDKLTCFKYQVIDPKSSGSTEYIWFDNKDYVLRKTRTESPDGTYEATFSYDKVEINEPSPVTELKANEVFVPGQGAVTFPGAGAQ